MEFAIASKKVLMEKRLPRYLTSLPQPYRLAGNRIASHTLYDKGEGQTGAISSNKEKSLFPTKLNELRVPFRTAR